MKTTTLKLALATLAATALLAWSLPLGIMGMVCLGCVVLDAATDR